MFLNQIFLMLENSSTSCSFLAAVAVFSHHEGPKLCFSTEFTFFLFVNSSTICSFLAALLFFSIWGAKCNYLLLRTRWKPRKKTTASGLNECERQSPRTPTRSFPTTRGDTAMHGFDHSTTGTFTETDVTVSAFSRVSSLYAKRFTLIFATDASKPGTFRIESNRPEGALPFGF